MSQKLDAGRKQLTAFLDRLLHLTGAQADGESLGLLPLAPQWQEWLDAPTADEAEATAQEFAKAFKLLPHGTHDEAKGGGIAVADEEQGAKKGTTKGDAKPHDEGAKVQWPRNWWPADRDTSSLRMVQQLLGRAVAQKNAIIQPAEPSPVLGLTGTAVPVELRANRPATVRLRVPADLRFRSVTLRLTGQPLMRDLARRDGDALWWGGEGRTTGRELELTLRQPARITAVVLTSGRLRTFIAEHLRSRDEDARWRARYAACLLMGLRRYEIGLGLGQPGAVTMLPALEYAQLGVPVPLGMDAQALTLSATAHDDQDDLSWQVLSPSCARAVAVCVGDDTPQQVLGAELGPDVSVATRDLAGAFQAALARAKAVDGSPGLVEIPIPLLSVQDGLVEVALAGTWERCRPVAVPASPVALAPHVPLAIPVPVFTPALAVDAKATVILRSRGAASGGMVLGLPADGALRYAVQVDERLHVAQALRLRALDDPRRGMAATLVAVWLCLESLPTTPLSLRLTLAPALDAGFTPGPELGVCTATLPVDRSAYEERAGGWWHRVAWKPGVELDGVQADQVLVLMASGDAAGLRLVHVQAPTATVQPTDQGTGCAHYRHLDRDRSWRPRSLQQVGTRWLVDVELAPGADEPVLWVNGEALHHGGGRWPEATWSATGAASLVITSSVAATLEWSGEVMAPA